MARKKIEPITGLGRDPDAQLTVQKSRPLYALWRSDLTLAEFKILDTYLSRIDSHKPDKRLVTFEKGELEQLLEVKKINTPELKERMVHLMGNVVEVTDSTAKKGFRLVTLFETAECEQDDNGTWQVKLECTQKAMRYFFNVDHLGYLRYKLRCITSLASRYSYILFLYLETNRFRKSWTVELQELKQILRCEEECYSKFKVFNDRLLKRCYKEINDKTECKYDYEPIKKGRSVVAIRFTVATLPPLEPVADPNQITLETYMNELQQDAIELLQEACQRDGEPEFATEQMAELLAVIYNVPDHKLPTVSDNLDLRRYHYLAAKYAGMNRIDSTKPIKNRFLYLLAIIKKDAIGE